MKTIEDIDISNKVVLIRCDLNVPIKDGIIEDDTRIVKSIKTIKYALKKASNVIIMSHLGRIKTNEDKVKNSLKIVCDRLSKLLNEEIYFCSYEEDIEDKIKNNKIIMLENVRFFDLNNKKESNCSEELSKFYASLADIYINDAFGVSHRKAASTFGVSKYLPSAVGFLVKEETEKLDELLNNPEKPFSLILGGAKVSDKIGIISSLIDNVDSIIIVGAMANTFLKAMNKNIGKSLVDIENLDYCKNLLKNYNDKIILPVDVYVSDKIDSNTKNLKNIDEINDDDIIFDIGPKTIFKINENISKAKTVFLNGPSGAFEYPLFSYGTEELLKILKSSGSKVIIGGGDSAFATIKFGYKNAFYHISTGGGASLEYLSRKEMPGFENIGDNNEKI